MQRQSAAYGPPICRIPRGGLLRSSDRCHDGGTAAQVAPMRSSLRDLLNQLVQRGWAKLDVQPGVPRPAPPGPWWTIELGTAVTTVSLHPWREGLLEFTITVLADDDNVIQSFELECNAMPVPVALINWWGGLDAALGQASWLRDELVAAWDREISAGGELP